MQAQRPGQPSVQQVSRAAGFLDKNTENLEKILALPFSDEKMKMLESLIFKAIPIQDTPEFRALTPIEQAKAKAIASLGIDVYDYHRDVKALFTYNSGAFDPDVNLPRDIKNIDKTLSELARFPQREPTIHKLVEMLYKLKAEKVAWLTNYQATLSTRMMLKAWQESEERKRADAAEQRRLDGAFLRYAKEVGDDAAQVALAKLKCENATFIKQQQALAKDRSVHAMALSNPILKQLLVEKPVGPWEKYLGGGGTRKGRSKKLKTLRRKRV
jgi:hypothetical protein